MAHAATIVASSTRLVHMVASFTQVVALKLPAGAGRQCRTPLEWASERGGPPRRTIAYFDDPLEPELLEPSPPGELPVVDFAAAPFVEVVGGLPETLSFFAIFFLAFFALCLGFTVVSVDTSVDDAVFAATFVLLLVGDSAARLRRCVSSFASAVVASGEWPGIDVSFEVVALPLLYVADEELLAILAFVPGAELLLSAYDMPCGFCEFAGTVGDALALTEPDAAGAVLDEVIGEDVLADESAGRPLSLEVEVVLGVVIVELDVSGAFWSFLKWPIASALPAASARMEVVRNMGASLRMVGPPGLELDPESG
jgi:hypothetical protein